MKTQIIQSVRAWGLLIPLGVVAGSLHAAAPLPVKPNILLMVGDDIGWGDIFSDNGGWISQGGNNGPLRGGKWGIYEGGQRVPFIWRWPGVVPAGKAYAAPVSSLDFMPTFAAMAGTAPPKDIDGLNLLPFLRGEQQGAPHGDLFWKLNEQCAIVRAPWKVVRFKGKPNNPELFDLGNDPGEQKNLAGDKPDMVIELDKAWNTWNATLPPAFVPPRLAPPKPAPPKPQPAQPDGNR